MKESSLLEILVNERMFTVLETALDNSTDYQEAVKAERKTYKKLKKANLNDRQKALLDRVIEPQTIATQYTEQLLTVRDFRMV